MIFTQQEPKTSLYHYCPDEAFLSILETAELWLTNNKGLNDYRDSDWMVTFIKKAFEGIKDESAKEVINDVHEQYSLNNQEVYVASFSENGDSLSQWRSYANDGDGVAIGFNPKAINIKAQVPTTSANSEHTIGFAKIKYMRDDELRELIKTIIDSHLDDSGIRDYFGVTEGILRGYTLTCKNPAFKEEAEWRLIYSPLITTHVEKMDIDVIGANTKLEFRAGAYGIVPYFRINLSGFTDDKSKLISHVVLGPKNKTLDGTVNMLLKKHGYTDARVSRSKATYR